MIVLPCRNELVVVLTGMEAESLMRVDDITPTLSYDLGDVHVYEMDVVPFSVSRVFAGHVTTGGSSSSTVTSKAHDLLLFDVSRATHVTVVTPRVKFAPELREQASVTPGALSDTLATKVCGVYDLLAMVDRSTDTGHDTTGGSRSRTVILNEHDPVLPAASVAMHVTFVGPTANCVDALGEHDDVTTPTLSLVTGLA